MALPSGVTRYWLDPRDAVIGAESSPGDPGTSPAVDPGSWLGLFLAAPPGQRPLEGSLTPLFAAVRASATPLPGLRCRGDVPGSRRTLELALLPVGDGGLELRVRALEVAPGRGWTPARPGLAACPWCMRVEVAGAWPPLDEVPGEAPLELGLGEPCPGCAEELVEAARAASARGRLLSEALALRPDGRADAPDLLEWVLGLDRLGDVLTHRAAIACVRGVMGCWERLHPDDGRPRAALEAAQRRVRGERLDGLEEAACAAELAAEQARRTLPPRGALEGAFRGAEKVAVAAGGVARLVDPWLDPGERARLLRLAVERSVAAGASAAWTALAAWNESERRLADAIAAELTPPASQPPR